MNPQAGANEKAYRQSLEDPEGFWAEATSLT
jgi:hypothetical protein